MKVNLNDLTLEQVHELQQLLVKVENTLSIEPQNSISALLGKNVIVRTVTMIYTGRLIGAGGSELILEDCSWIPETARFAQFAAAGEVRECEPYPKGLPVYINKGALLDMCELRAELPREQK